MDVFVIESNFSQGIDKKSRREGVVCLEPQGGCKKNVLDFYGICCLISDPLSPYGGQKSKSYIFLYMYIIRIRTGSRPP